MEEFLIEELTVS